MKKEKREQIRKKKASKKKMMKKLAESIQNLGGDLWFCTFLKVNC